MATRQQLVDAGLWDAADVRDPSADEDAARELALKFDNISTWEDAGGAGLRTYIVFGGKTYQATAATFAASVAAAALATK